MRKRKFRLQDWYSLMYRVKYYVKMNCLGAPSREKKIIYHLCIKNQEAASVP